MANDILTLTDHLVDNLPAKDKPYENFDARCTGLALRVEKSGRKIWWLYLYTPDTADTRRRYRWKIGEYPTFHLFGRRPPKASDRRRDVRNVAEDLKAQSRTTDLREHKRRAIAKAKAEKTAKLGDFMDSTYLNYVKENHKQHRPGDADVSVRYLKTQFKTLTDKRIDTLTHLDIHRWMREANKKKLAASTIKRRLGALAKVLTLAVGHGLIDKHPLQAAQMSHPTSSLKIPRPKNKTPRFLSDDEANRLRAALKARDRDLKAKRLRTIDNYHARGRTLPPAITGAYADYLTPLVLLALNTGIRRGGLLGLRWKDITENPARPGSWEVRVRRGLDKAGKGYTVSLNTDTVAVMRLWKSQAANPDADLVFPHPVTGAKMHDIRTSWLALMQRADIQSFRFHDLRHTFASFLVMGGVDLNTIRELLGHASLDMTLKYAHLSEEHRQDAVAVLNV